MSGVLLSVTPSPDDSSSSAQDLQLTAEAAAHAGLQLVHLPHDLRAQPLDLVLDRAPQSGWAVISSRILASASYRAIEHAAGRRGLGLVQSHTMQRRAMRFDEFYPLLSDLTARSEVLSDPNAAATTLSRLGPQVFVKGQVKSAKEHGWHACTCSDEQALQRMIRRHGQVVVRELLDLRRSGEQVLGFPTAREYRVYLLDAEVLGLGYYWDGTDPFGTLSTSELADVRELAVQAAQRLACRLLAIDVAQRADGSWMIIEAGDPQHSGLVHMSRIAYFSALQRHLG